MKHTHTHMYIYIYIYICAWVCVCGCVYMYIYTHGPQYYDQRYGARMTATVFEYLRFSVLYIYIYIYIYVCVCVCVCWGIQSVYSKPHRQIGP